MLGAQSKGTKPPTLGTQQNSFLQSFEVKAEHEKSERKIDRIGISVSIIPRLRKVVDVE